MSWLEPVTLRSSRVTLAPLHRRHRDELIEAINDGELFRLWYTSVPAPQTMEAEIDRRLSQRLLYAAARKHASGAAFAINWT